MASIDAEARKSRAEARRARILASASSRMAVVTGVPPSRLVVPGPVTTTSSDEDVAPSPPNVMSMVQLDRARRRLDAVYSMVLFLFWVGAGISQGIFAFKCSVVVMLAVFLSLWLLFALANRCLRWRIQGALPAKDEAGQLGVVADIAEVMLQGQRMVVDCINGTALLVFIYVMCQHGPLAPYCSHVPVRDSTRS